MTTLTTKTINELETATALAGTDLVLINQGGVTIKKGQVQALLDYLTAHFILVSINDAGDVNTAGKATGHVLTWNGSQWVPANVPITGATQLDQLTDVDLDPGPLDGQALVFDSDDGQWKPGSVAAGAGGGTVTVIPEMIGCMTTRADDFVDQDFTTATAIPWDTDVYDSDGFHSLVTNNTRITIPAGQHFIKARLTASLGFLSIGSNMTVIVQIRKNGSLEYNGVGAINTNTGIASTAQVSCSTPVIPIADNDYFEVFVQVLGDAAVTIDASRSTFSIQVVEVDDAAPTPALGELSDVNVAGAASGARLAFDGTNWVAVLSSATTSALNDLVDVDTTGVATGDRLAYNGTGWVDEKPHGNLGAQSLTGNGTLSINRNLGEVVRLSLTGNVTAFSVSGWPTTGNLGRLVLEISSTGAFNINTWPTGTLWAGGTVPTITSGTGRRDLIILTTFNGGTTIYGAVAGQDFI